MGAMNVAMTFVSLALIGEIIMYPHFGHQNHYDPHHTIIIIIIIVSISEKAGRKVQMVSELTLMLCMAIIILITIPILLLLIIIIIGIIIFLIRESWTQSLDGFRTEPDAVHDNPSTCQPPYFCES